MAQKLLNGERVVIMPHGMYVNGIKQTDQKCISEYLRIMFWERVAIKAEDNLCWEWMGGTNTKGYGATTYNGTSTAASRKAYMLHYNVVLHDKSMLVCHTCDNPVCCNPNHLFLGTKSDNGIDMFIKGRGKGQYMVGQIKNEDIFKGSKNPNSKLKEKDVIEIRRLRNVNMVSLKKISQLFKMSASTICEIVNYKKWKHVN